MTDASSDRLAPPASSVPEARRYFFLLLALLTPLYLLLQNGFWSPGSDSEFYVSTARNLLNGNGYTFNGAPFGHYPPGWPAFLAGVMTVTDAFWALNLITKILLLSAALIYYRVMLYVTTPTRAFGCVAISATLYWWFRCAYLLYSESLFMVLLGLALLLAFQMAEGRVRGWRIVALVALCALLPSVRWLGAFAAGVVALTVVSGERKPALNRKWVTFALSLVAAGTVFVVLYVTTCNGVFARWTGASVTQSASPGMAIALGDNPSAVVATSVLQNIPILRRTNIPAYAGRALSGGVWMSHQFWPVTELAESNRAVFWVSDLVGWLLWLCAGLFIVVRVKERKWLWLGLALYAAMLIVRWPSAKGRYLVTFGPFWILALWSGLEIAGAWLTRRRPGLTRFAAAMPAAVLLVIVFSNVSLLAVEIWVQRTPDYYARYEAGQFEPLLDAAHYIRANAPPGAGIAVATGNDNLGRRATGRLVMSSMAMLTDHPMTPIVARKAARPDPSVVAGLMKEKSNVAYYLYRPPISPWRLWHFEAPWLQRMMTGEEVIPRNPAWELYRIADGVAVKVDAPHIEGWPRQVPAAVSSTPNCEVGLTSPCPIDIPSE